MSILINAQTRAIVQGITGGQGAFHTKLMQEYGTNIVAGVTPGKGGTTVEGVKVYDTVRETVVAEQPDWSVIFVPAPFVKDAALEALDNDLNIVVITEGVPVHDELTIVARAEEKGLVVIGPNCPGLLTVNEAKLGIIPGHIFTSKGNVGVVSRSGTLTYEIVALLADKGMGVTTAVGIGGDPIIGSTFLDILTLFQADPETEKIVMLGEIGGNMEEETAAFIKQNITKPIGCYIAGQTAPKGKTMGHAGAIISGKSGTAQSKMEALSAVGVKVGKIPSEVVNLIA
ncbi:MAG TPA: succinate--CoA ligase subunit alpha [bacterium]|nr:succinate--CoA ligase subunit alpha [bacterium]